MTVPNKRFLLFLKQGTIKTRVSQRGCRCQLKRLYGNGSTKERTIRKGGKGSGKHYRGGGNGFDGGVCVCEGAVMITAIWRNGDGFFGKKADPQRVAEEIIEIGETATPDQIVERARDEKSELHKLFTWDDTEAAEKWRKQEARQITYHLIIKETVREDLPPARVFSITETGYKQTNLIFRKSDEHEMLLKRAMAELRAFKAKYSMLQELEEILNMIE